MLGDLLFLLGAGLMLVGGSHSLSAVAWVRRHKQSQRFRTVTVGSAARVVTHDPWGRYGRRGVLGLGALLGMLLVPGPAGGARGMVQGLLGLAADGMLGAGALGVLWSALSLWQVRRAFAIRGRGDYSRAELRGLDVVPKLQVLERQLEQVHQELVARERACTQVRSALDNPFVGQDHRAAAEEQLSEEETRLATSRDALTSLATRLTEYRVAGLAEVFRRNLEAVLHGTRTAGRSPAPTLDALALAADHAAKQIDGGYAPFDLPRAFEACCRGQIDLCQEGWRRTATDAAEKGRLRARSHIDAVHAAVHQQVADRDVATALQSLEDTRQRRAMTGRSREEDLVAALLTLQQSTAQRMAEMDALESSLRTSAGNPEAGVAEATLAALDACDEVDGGAVWGDSDGEPSQAEGEEAEETDRAAAGPDLGATGTAS